MEAFTLVELLVTTGVIVFLIALAIPAGLSMRKSADNLRCVTNLRAIARGALAWGNDHQDRLPDSSRWSGFIRGQSTDDLSILPYIGLGGPQDSSQDTVLTCPAYRARYMPKEGASVVNSFRRTYGLNMYLFGSKQGYTTPREGGPTAEDFSHSYLRIRNVQDPGATAFFFDGPVTPSLEGGGTYNVIFQYPEWRVTGPESPGVKGTDYIHSGGINVVFLDGHVEWVTPARVNDEGWNDKRHQFWGRKP